MNSRRPHPLADAADSGRCRCARPSSASGRTANCRTGAVPPRPVAAHQARRPSNCAALRREQCQPWWCPALYRQSSNLQGRRAFRLPPQRFADARRNGRFQQNVSWLDGDEVVFDDGKPSSTASATMSGHRMAGAGRPTSFSSMTTPPANAGRRSSSSPRPMAARRQPPSTCASSAARKSPCRLAPSTPSALKPSAAT